MSINQAMIKLQAIQDQMQRVGGAKEGLLAIYQTLGTVFAAVDAAEAARNPGGISPEGFEAMRLGMNQALTALDAAIAVVSAQFRGVQKAAADTADDINAIQLNMKRSLGMPSVGGNPNN